MVRHAFHPTPGRTILCVDDSQIFLEATRSLLTRRGHEVRTATSVQDGLAELRRGGIDLLLVDYALDGETAEDLLCEVRDPNLQVVLLTGYASERPPVEVLDHLNVQGYCDKSRGPEELDLWIHVALRQAERIGAIEASRARLRRMLALFLSESLWNGKARSEIGQLLARGSEILGGASLAVVLGKPEDANDDFDIVASHGPFPENARLGEAVEQFGEDFSLIAIDQDESSRSLLAVHPAVEVGTESWTLASAVARLVAPFVRNLHLAQTEPPTDFVM